MKATQIRAISRIIKNAEKKQPRIDAIHGIFADGDGRACASDGFRAIRLNTRPDGFPDAPGVDLARFFADSFGDVLPLPTVKEINEIIKAGGKPPVFDFGEDLPQVNARYLLDILRVFPDAVCYRTKTKPKNKAIYFVSAFGDGLLLPLRKN